MTIKTYSRLGILLFTLLLAACSATPLEKGNQAREDGNYDQALLEYTTVLTEGNSPEDQFSALNGRAWVYDKQGKPELALADYATALDLSTDDGIPAGNLSSVYRNRIDILTQMEEWEQAADEIGGLIKSDPENIPLHLEQGQKYALAQVWEKVVSSMDGALAIDPSNADALTLRGTANLELRNFEAAIEDLKSSLDGEIAAALSDIDRRSNLSTAFYELGSTLYKLGEYQRAVVNFTSAVEFAESDEDLAITFAERGFVYAEMGDNEKALEDYNQAISLYPKYPTAYAYRSYIFSDLNDYDAAITDANKAIELASNSPADEQSALFHALASVLDANGQPAEALEAATKSIELAGKDSPETARTYNLRGYINRGLEEYEQALNDANRAVELGASDLVALPDFYSSRSVTHYRLEDYSAALADQLAAIELGYSSAGEYGYLGDIYYYLDDIPQSVTAYKTAIDIDPNDAWLYFYLGDIFEINGDDENAAVYYQNAVELDSEEVLFISSLADAALRLEDYKTAQQHYQRTIELDPTDAWHHNFLGDAYYGQDDFKSAESAFRAAIDLDSTIPLYFENLGLVLRLQSKLETSVEAYSVALELDDERLYSWYGRGYAYYLMNQDELAIIDLRRTKTFELEKDFEDIVDELLVDMGG